MTKTPAHIESAIDKAYQIQCLLSVISLAVDGEQIAGTTFVKAGGGSVIDMAADMAAEMIEGLEVGS